MWISRVKYDELIAEKSKRTEISSRLDKIEENHLAINQENAELKDDLKNMSHKLNNRDIKVKELMKSVSHLNRDLDAWEPLSNLIASTRCEEGVTLTVPRKGVYLLNKLLDKK